MTIVARFIRWLLKLLGLLGPSITHRVAGRIASRTSGGVDGLRVAVVDKGVGGDAELAEAVTDTTGKYQASFCDAELRRAGKDKPDLQAFVYAGDTLVGSSEIRYDASTEETLDILLDAAAAALPSEYETLTGAVSRHHQGSLAALEETDERGDITYLAGKTGWDARAVALAALADQFSARAERGAIPAPLFYALFRAGLPANEAALYRTEPGGVERIWRQALDQGIIPSALEAQLPEAVAAFERLGVERLLDGPALVGTSGLKELLAPSLDEAQQREFATLHARHAEAPDALWDAAGKAFGEATAKRLRLDGQLAYLTLNNAPLIATLHETAGQDALTDPAQLVAAGFHRPGRWREAFGREPVPPEIPGRNDGEKRERYAELLAAQLRLSFPTAVMARMVKDGETPLGSAKAQRDVSGFLTRHEGKFEIGLQPVAQFVASNAISVDSEVIRQIGRIQRVYQITPDDDAMNGLLKEGVDSAGAAMRYGREEFVRVFKGSVGGELKARLIHDKARQVHSAVLNLAVDYLTAKNAPQISALTIADDAPAAPAAPAHAGDVLAYATLESLFGEMDYCACDHCRSVLSPAAYLVDLLLFLDRPANLDPQPVPFPANAGGSGTVPAPPRPYFNPQEVLLERRPDIAHLPLTCENVNTPVPNIDLVIAALTYYVAHGLSLTGYAGCSVDGSARPEELLADPRWVDAAADDELAGASFPPPLPFHRPLESLRRHLSRFEAPLAEIMADLRKDDSLDRVSDADYGWRDVWMETLGLSRPEHGLLTQGWTTAGSPDLMLTVKHLYGFEPTSVDSEALETLRNARAFCRRVGISYEELAGILRTRFVNPAADLIPRLERLGVSIASIKALKAGTLVGPAFDALLAPGLDTKPFDDDVQAWLTDTANHDRIMRLLTLTNSIDPEDVCNFEAVELRYAKSDQPSPLEFVRLIRFIRLWKKLGWSLEQTDEALAALWPSTQIPNDPSEAVNLTRLDAGFRDVLPRLAVLRRAMEMLNLSAGKDLARLLACVGPIGVRGETSLYRKMFLNQSLGDEAFAMDSSGDVLTSGALLLDHAAALRGAFALTGDEFDRIAAALEFDATTTLTLDNVSMVSRRGWLARKLKLSVDEFLALTRSTRLDPFGPPDPAAPALLRLIELVRALRARAIKPAQLLYLLWNHDLSGKSARSEADAAALARTMRGTLAAAESEFALDDDPDGAIARARMSLVYGNETTDFFFGLLEDRIVAAIDYTHDEAALDQAIIDAAPGLIAYDDFARQLSFAGVMSNIAAGALKAVPGVSPAFKSAVDDLLDENAKKVGPFFARFPELRPLHDAYEASAEPEAARRNALLAALLPDLRKKRREQLAKQAIAAATAADARLVDALTEDSAALHAAGAAASPALDDFLAVAAPGLAGEYFFSAPFSGKPDLIRPEEPNLAFAASGANPLPPSTSAPGADMLVRLSGYVEAPEDGPYNIRIDADAGAKATLVIDGVEIALTQTAGTWRNSSSVRLRAGTLHTLSLTVADVKSELALRWQTQARGWEVVPPSNLYSAVLVGNLREAYVRILKTAALADAFKLTPDEIAHLARDSAYQLAGEGWLNLLPVTGGADAVTAGALARALAALIDYASLKARLSPSDGRLLTILRDPQAASAGPDSAIAALTGWDPESLGTLLERFGATVADLAHIKVLRRIHDAFAWAKKLSVPAAALVEAATNEPTAETVRNLQAALRARYDESGWLDVLKPINDEMRSLQRDALVARILHEMRTRSGTAHIDTPDKLFEYFLMDVQMEPCTLTSPIRHALSSVQLFIERCFMNVEARVLPSSLDAKQWPAMKRYRLWEANRKVFLYPENWLDGGLRDDQSPIFREVMSELLQGDITEDRAAQALTGYLTRLEEVAKLETCGIHYEENEQGRSDDIAHLVGRTAGANRKYFYRRRERGSWTPWEKIDLNIEDNPVLPVVWRDRLFLFWLKVMKETTPPDPPTTPGGGPALADVNAVSVFRRAEPTLTVKVILNWSERVGGTWQPVRTSDPNHPLLLGMDIPLWRQETIRSELSLFALFPGKALEIVALYDNGSALPYVRSKSGMVADNPIGAPKGRRGSSSMFESAIATSIRIDAPVVMRGSSFLLHNPFSTPELKSRREPVPNRTLDTGGRVLKVGYAGSGTPDVVVNNPLRAQAVQPRHPTGGNPWDMPFLYEDSRHVFYVTTEQRTVTVPYWRNFGLFEQARVGSIAIPALISPVAADFIRRPDGRFAPPGFTVVDPAPIDLSTVRSEIFQAAISPQGTVLYGGTEIGPTGGPPRTVPSR